MSRRAALRGAAAATAAVAAGLAVAGRASPARAHNMPLEEFQAAYELPQTERVPPDGVRLS